MTGTGALTSTHDALMATLTKHVSCRLRFPERNEVAYECGVSFPVGRLTSLAEMDREHTARALIASGAVMDAAANVAGRANANDLRYAATALEASSDNGDRYCAARLRGLADALTDPPGEGDQR